VLSDGYGEVRFYGGGRPEGRYCASFQLIAHPERETGYSFARDGREALTGRLAPGATEVVRFVLIGLTDIDHTNVRVTGDGLRVAGVSAVRC
jgi:hypothetical protein